MQGERERIVEQNNLHSIQKVYYKDQINLDSFLEAVKFYSHNDKGNSNTVG